jgi:hypothetical protein
MEQHAKIASQKLAVNVDTTKEFPRVQSAISPHLKLKPAVKQ